MNKKQKKELTGSLNLIAIALIFIPLLLIEFENQNFSVYHFISIILGVVSVISAEFIKAIPEEKVQKQNLIETDITNQLLNLNKLLKEEIISKEEYDQKREELVKKL